MAAKGTVVLSEGERKDCDMRRKNVQSAEGESRRRMNNEKTQSVVRMHLYLYFESKSYNRIILRVRKEEIFFVYVAYRCLFPLSSCENYSDTKNFPHSALENRLQLTRTVLATSNPKNVVRACAYGKSAL